MKDTSLTYLIETKWTPQRKSNNLLEDVNFSYLINKKRRNRNQGKVTLKI